MRWPYATLGSFQRFEDRLTPSRPDFFLITFSIKQKTDTKKKEKGYEQRGHDSAGSIKQDNTHQYTCKWL